MKRPKKQISGWKIIFREFFKYKKQVILLSFLGIIYAIASGFVPYLAGQLIDAISNTSRNFILFNIEAPVWAGFLALWAGAQLISNNLDWVGNRKVNKIALLTEMDYLAKGLGYLLKLPIAFHKNKTSGEIFNKIQNASMWLEQILRTFIKNLIPQFLSIAVGLSIAFYINYIFSFIIIAGIFVYIIILIKIVPPTVELEKKAHDKANDIYGDAWGLVDNVQPIKQAGAEDYENKKLKKRFTDLAEKTWLKIRYIWENINFFQKIIIILTQFAIFVLSVSFIHSGAMTIGELIALNGYAALVFGPFVILGYNWQTIQNGIVALEKAEEILNISTEDYTPKEKVEVKEIGGRIDFKNVYFTYEKSASVLKNINLQIKTGETVALVGESGVGKSTLIDLISGYYFSDKGDIFIDGYNIKKMDLKFLRENIAVVPQEVVLFNDTIKMNLKYGSFKATDEEIELAAKEAGADDFINKFSKKYNQVVGERGIKLSVGQKQRIAIARAILRNPKILILDEPTSALDIKTEKYITESLERLMRGRTTIVIAHRLSTARKADKIFVLDKGQIVEEGKHEELLKKERGIYKDFYKLYLEK